MLSMRTRGKNGIHYIRGTISLGDKRINVKEFSSGTSDADAASHLMADYEMKLRHQLMFGPAVLVAEGVMADAFDSYLTKSPPPGPSDVLRIGKLNAHVGDFPLREPKAAWDEFRRTHLMGHAAAGQDRYRSVLQAAINVHHELHDLAPIKLKAIPFDNQRVRFLSREERDRLIASYAPHVQPVILMLAFHGPRVQTAIQMQWGMNGVDLPNEAMRLNHSKNAVIQSVPLHPRVKAALFPIWEARGKPSRGHVFLNKHGLPYQDTRLSPVPGGNPIRRAHATALAKADIEDFTVHDWRHHWASHCVMAGIDLITIMHMGGWKSLRMVQRYASVGVEHMRAAIHKLE